MINFDKFLASFITETKKYKPVTNYNIPACIRKALDDQGLIYKDGEIVKTQRRISAETKEAGYGESEDERIRKEIIDFLQETIENVGESPNIWTMNNAKKWVAWLEKQGASIDVDSILNKVGIKPAYKDGNAWCILYGDNIQDGVCGFGYTKEEALIEFLKDLLEKQVEQNHSEQDLKMAAKPKFNISDWIVSDLEDVNEDFRLCKIIGIEDGCYKIQSANGCKGYNFFEIWESDYHLWSIEDAKDGDVLAYVTDEEDLWIMIYWSLYEPYEGHVHYHALLINDNFSDKGTCCICIDNLKPATKEQRDLLFQKMREAGYLWDTKKKELEKIGQKPTWSEDNEEIVKLANEYYDKVLLKECGMKENEAHHCRISYIHGAKAMLKRQNWRPSDEQMTALDESSSRVGMFTQKGILLHSLYNDLKKL